MVPFHFFVKYRCILFRVLVPMCFVLSFCLFPSDLYLAFCIGVLFSIYDKKKWSELKSILYLSCFLAMVLGLGLAAWPCMGLSSYSRKNLGLGSCLYWLVLSCVILAYLVSACVVLSFLPFPCSYACLSSSARRPFIFITPKLRHFSQHSVVCSNVER